MRPETLGEYGSPITLPCEAVGIPAPTMAWYRNAQPIGNSPGGQYIVEEDGSLTIKKLKIEDMGMFQCLAVNEAGEDSTYTWLKVKSKFLATGRSKSQFAQVAVLIPGMISTRFSY